MSKFTFEMFKIEKDYFRYNKVFKKVSVYANNEEETRVKALDKAGKGYKFYE